jgi:hypothetical protein
MHIDESGCSRKWQTRSVQRADAALVPLARAFPNQRTLLLHPLRLESYRIPTTSPFCECTEGLQGFLATHKITIYAFLPVDAVSRLCRIAWTMRLGCSLE